MNIPELIKEAHDNAVERGFYYGEGGYCSECKQYSSCDSEYKEDAGSCDMWEDPNKNIGELLMLIVSELGEALEAHRCGKFADSSMLVIISDYIYEEDFNQAVMQFEDCIKSTFEDEIADVFIRLFDLCAYIDFDLNDECRLSLKGNFNVGEELFSYISYLQDFHKDNNDTSMLQFFYGCLATFCEKLNIPIEKHIKAKMAYNRTRPHKHGKGY